MSMLTDGSHACDNCGADVGNGGVSECVVVSDLKPGERGMVTNYHFCRDREEDGKEIKGCERKLLRPSVMKYRRELEEGHDPA